MLKDKNFIEAVTERDIDLLLLEELTVSEPFFKWFTSKIIDFHKPKRVGIWHSVNQAQLGETDLILVVKELNKIIGILLENKIGAIAQKNQAQRYYLRGEKGIEKGDWSEFKTCLISPKNYFENSKDAKEYDVHIFYEDIQSWFSSHKDNQRMGYKANIIKEAIEQNRRGYQMKPNKNVTDFWNKYWEYCTTNYPELEMNEPGLRPISSDWIYFTPLELNKRIKLVHKLQRGLIDMQISGGLSELESIKQDNKSLIDNDMIITSAGKSAVIRIKTDIINRFEDFNEQIKSVEKSLKAAKRLLKIALGIKL